jgi:hypothetical protein
LVRAGGREKGREGERVKGKRFVNGVRKKKYLSVY